MSNRPFTMILAPQVGDLIRYAPFGVLRDEWTNLRTGVVLEARTASKTQKPGFVVDGATASDDRDELTERTGHWFIYPEEVLEVVERSFSDVRVEHHADGSCTLPGAHPAREEGHPFVDKVFSELFPKTVAAIEAIKAEALRAPLTEEPDASTGVGGRTLAQIADEEPTLVDTAPPEGCSGVFPIPAPVDLKQWRKDRPLFRGCVAYFPDALLEVANISRIGNEQHNPGQPIHWAFGKSMDHKDCELRHMIDGDELDDDGALHLAKTAWRALADLQTFLETRDPTLHARRQAQRDRAARGER